MENKFYFCLSLHFKSDFDVASLQDTLGITATKLTPLAMSKGPKENASAKFYYKTQEFCEIYSDEIFAKFVEKLSDKADVISEILENNNGECNISIVFTELNGKPMLSLDNKTINLLSALHANFDVDFI